MLSTTLTLPCAPTRAAAVSAATQVPLAWRVMLIDTTESKCEARNSNCRRKSPGGGCEVFGCAGLVRSSAKNSSGVRLTLSR